MPRTFRWLLALACPVLLWQAVAGGEDAKTAPPAEIERLIKQLGSDQFDQREAASRALEAIGEPGREALLKAVGRGEDAEVQRRAEQVLAALDAKVYRELRCFTGHERSVFCAAFSPDGRQVLTGSADETMRLWDVETGKALHSFEGHTGAVFSVAFSPDGKLVVSGGEEKTIRLWRVAPEAVRSASRAAGAGGLKRE